MNYIYLYNAPFYISILFSQNLGTPPQNFPESVMLVVLHKL